MKRIWIAIGLLALLSPIGLFLPEYFGAGDAWGEWSLETVKEQTGREPEGMKKDADLYNAPVPDYSFGEEEDTLAKKSVGYIGSALLGVGLILLLTLGASKLAMQKDRG
ncbi:MAG: PDGLE domain-containing protein [Saprospirales bacterium]|nr:PDGLE domain-containing protein [Saprospirales bacterium]